MADREDSVEDCDVVVWHSFGLTHNPRFVFLPRKTVHPIHHHINTY